MRHREGIGNRKCPATPVFKNKVQILSRQILNPFTPGRCKKYTHHIMGEPLFFQHAANKPANPDFLCALDFVNSNDNITDRTSLTGEALLRRLAFQCILKFGRILNTA